MATIVTADENYLRESILTPAAKVTAGYQPVMPAFQGLVSEEQLLALIEYVKSLSTQQENVESIMAAEFPAKHYLNDGYGITSWLLTRDHKRIALLYLAAVTFFFFVGGAFAVLIRLDLATPAGDLVSDDTYNQLFTMHGVVMVFFFLIPAIPAILGNFLVPLMIGAKDLAFPKLNLLSWYIYMLGGLMGVYVAADRRPRHRLDDVRAIEHEVLDDDGSSRPRSPSSSPAFRRSSPGSTSSSRFTACGRPG